MKNLDIYLEEVKYYLINKDKNDILKEIRMNILNKLGDDYTEKQLIEILEELGEPSVFANQYNKNNGIYITEKNYINFVNILKILVIIGVIVSCINSIDFLWDYERIRFDINRFSVFLAILAILRNIIMFTIFSIGVLTTVFYFIEKNNVNNEILSEANNEVDQIWTVKNLKGKRYSFQDYVISTISVVFWSLAFIFIINRATPSEYQFFKKEYLFLFIIIILVSVLMEIIKNSYKCFVGENKVFYVILNIVCNIYAIFSSAFVLLYKKMFYIPTIIQNDIGNEVFYIIFFITIIICSFSIVFSIYRYIKLK
ncbi:MAG: hypothetical protein ACK5LY_07410 [Lachnospirales bacterium]